MNFQTFTSNAGLPLSYPRSTLHLVAIWMAVLGVITCRIWHGQILLPAALLQCLESPHYDRITVMRPALPFPQPTHLPVFIALGSITAIHCCQPEIWARPAILPFNPLTVNDHSLEFLPRLNLVIPLTPFISSGLPGKGTYMSYCSWLSDCSLFSIPPLKSLLKAARMIFLKDQAWSCYHLFNWDFNNFSRKEETFLTWCSCDLHDLAAPLPIFILRCPTTLASSEILTISSIYVYISLSLLMLAQYLTSFNHLCHSGLNTPVRLFPHFFTHAHHPTPWKGYSSRSALCLSVVFSI